MFNSGLVEMAKNGIQQLLKSSRSTSKQLPTTDDSTSTSLPPTPSARPGSPSPDRPIISSSLFQVVLGYLAEQDGEIPLLPGQLVASVKDLGNGWSLGKNVTSDNVVGIFPSTCVMPMTAFPCSNLTLQSSGVCQGHQDLGVAEDIVTQMDQRSSAGVIMTSEGTGSGVWGEDDGKCYCEHHMTIARAYCQCQLTPCQGQLTPREGQLTQCLIHGNSSVCQLQCCDEHHVYFTEHAQAGADAAGGAAGGATFHCTGCSNGDLPLPQPPPPGAPPPPGCAANNSHQYILQNLSQHHHSPAEAKLASQPYVTSSGFQAYLTSSPMTLSGSARHLAEHRQMDHDRGTWGRRKPRMIVKPNLDKSFAQDSATPQDAEDADRGGTNFASGPHEFNNSRNQQDLSNGRLTKIGQQQPLEPPCDLLQRSTSARRLVGSARSDTSSADVGQCEIHELHENAFSRSIGALGTSIPEGSGNFSLQQELANLARGESENQTSLSSSLRKDTAVSDGDDDNLRYYYRDYRCVEIPLDKSSHHHRQHQRHGSLNIDAISAKTTDDGYGIVRQNDDDENVDAGSTWRLKRNHAKISRPGAAHIALRLVGSVAVGQLTGLILFLWMFYQLDYSFVVVAAVAGTASALLSIFFVLSRVFRCTAAILIPSASTTRGRVACVIILTGFLLGGPVSNVYVNMSDISRSMSCSAEQAHNQTNFLLRPFDAMMRHLNSTILRLEEAARSVSRGLRPLDDGLANVEMDLYNGKLQLLGTRKTCKTLIDRAYNACTSGIHKAQDQCLGVMGALGTVYHHARVVLDRINPDRWSNRQPAGGSSTILGSTLLQKRQVLVDDNSVLDEIELSASDRDICEPLDTLLVCHTLNDSDSLCQPSRWAGEAIQDAINSTQEAMSGLQAALQFYVSSDPYSASRQNASEETYEIQRRVEEEFAARTEYFQMTLSLLQKLIPLSILLLIYSCYIYLKLYMTRDWYDNVYVSDRLHTIDEFRHRRTSATRHFARTANIATNIGTAAGGVFPLKRYERRHLIDTTTHRLSPVERGRYRSGLCVFFLHLLLAITCYTFDYVLYWVLALVQRHAARPGFDPTGGNSLELVLAGEGIIVELLDVFLKGFHTDHGFSFVGDTHACLPSPVPPSVEQLVLLVLLYILLLLTILLKSRAFRARNRITGYFYGDRERSRLVYLSHVIAEQRSRLPYSLHKVVRANFRSTCLLRNGNQLLCCAGLPNRWSSRRWRRQDGAEEPMTSQGLPMSYHRPSHRCLVCLRRRRHRHSANDDEEEEKSFHDCPTEFCGGLYCRDCFDDLRHICPLCQASCSVVPREGVGGGEREREGEGPVGGTYSATDTMATGCNDNFEYDDVEYPDPVAAVDGAQPGTCSSAVAPQFVTGPQACSENDDDDDDLDPVWPYL